MTLEFAVDENATDRDIAVAFIHWLEGMGARFSWRDASVGMIGISPLMASRAWSVRRRRRLRARRLTTAM